MYVWSRFFPARKKKSSVPFSIRFESPIGVLPDQKKRKTCDWSGVKGHVKFRWDGSIYHATSVYGLSATSERDPWRYIYLSTEVGIKSRPLPVVIMVAFLCNCYAPTAKCSTDQTSRYMFVCVCATRLCCCCCWASSCCFPPTCSMSSCCSCAGPKQTPPLFVLHSPDFWRLQSWLVSRSPRTLSSLTPPLSLLCRLYTSNNYLLIVAVTSSPGRWYFPDGEWGASSGKKRE